MRLKRLDIVGFKSFLDRTVVQFHDGVTGIVGPNGCGKSNIVDAIRWVLGEQSPKHLRGSAMQDVIFNGSQSQAPVNMAEVTLTFVNDNPDEIPARYRSFAEIAVTRRLFRNGDSEYLINKSPCRLMDITEVFLGTGVGTKAYSIIEQGRIGLIVSAKPEDRRALIEEAAGITRYKSKRRIAERKMEHTRTNLLRVGDVVSELKRRLESLSRQAKKAERYKKLKHQLREIELHIAAHRWLEINATRSWIDTDLENRQEQALKLAGEISSLEKDVRARRDRLASEEARLSEIQSRAAEAEGKAKVHLERVAGVGRERASLDVRNEQAQREILALDAKRALLSKKTGEEKEELARLEAALAEGRALLEERLEDLSKAEAQARHLGELAQVERSAAANASSAFTQGESQLLSLNRHREDLEVRQAKAASEIDELEKRLDSIEESRHALEGSLDTTRQLHLELESERTTTNEALVRCKLALEESQGELEAIKDVLSDKRGRLQSLEEIQRNYEGYQSGVRDVMLREEGIEGVSQADITGLVADIVRAEPPHELAVEAVLGERLQQILVADQSTGMALISWLNSRDTGRSAFLPIGELRCTTSDPARAHSLDGGPGVVAAALDIVQREKEHEALLRHLLADVVIVETIEDAIRLWREHEGLTFVTLAGEVVTPSGTMIGGSRDAAGVGLLKARREIDELRAEVRRQEAAFAAATETRSRVRRRLDGLEEGLARLSEKTHAEQINIVSQEKEVHRLSDEARHLSSRLEAVETERARIADSIFEANSEIEATEARTTMARTERDSREARFDDLNEQLQEMNSSVASLQDSVTVLRVRVAEDVQRRDALAKRIEMAQESLKETEERAAGLKKTIAGSDTEFDALASRAAEDEAEAERLTKEAESMRVAATRGRQSLVSASEAVKDDEKRLDEMRSWHEQASSDLSRLEMDSREMAIEINHLAETVLERHATELCEAVHTWHLLPPPSEEQFDRLEVLRRRIERVGEVNLTAIQEHEEISERHEFLHGQKEDLEKSLQQLEKAIERIDKTSKTRFMETFARVDELFQKVFPRLFNGGKAGLSLSEPHDPLRSGVEIFAQPPGKKLQNVNLLSGGEKALTATSLIFAMFLVRPTPFCLLDEVDAPLDDQNVHRYNQLVREMSRRSQFILITHNKTTMEFVDTLYGVTMEEPGISKLVSARLSGVGPAVAA